jgi:hypothetical protein
MTSKETAQKILDTANELGFQVAVRGAILTITKHITPNSNEAFREADMSYYSVLGLLNRTSPGSDWGASPAWTVGALEAIKSGRFVMNRSGGSVRVLNAIKKLL